MLFRDKNCLLNPGKCFISVKYHIVKNENDALEKTDYVSPLQVTFLPPSNLMHPFLTIFLTQVLVLFLQPLSHCLFESFSLNIGECEIYNISKLYPIWAKLHFMLDVSKESKESFRSFFEGYTPSINEEVSNFQFSRRIAHFLYSFSNRYSNTFFN